MRGARWYSGVDGRQRGVAFVRERGTSSYHTSLGVLSDSV
jgi:hypothetical protein